jgi:hypothetical protein
MASDFLDSCDAKLERLNAAIKRLEKYEPVQTATVPAPPAMHCPRCQTLMSAGELSFHEDWESFFVFGFGFETAWFQPMDGGKAQRLFKTTKRVKAYRCSTCATVILPGNELK